jgi:predicted MFS family arabinose efflux permease
MRVSAEATLAHSSTQPPPHLRRNFWLGVTNGIAYNLYIVILSTEVVMALFVSKLTDSNLLISLVIPIDLGSWYFLQLLFSGYVQRRPRGLPLYRLMGAVRVAAGTVLALAAFTLKPSPILLAVFLIGFAVNSVAAGVAALPFMNVVAKTIPITRRGSFFGWRRFLGGVLGLAGGVLVKTVLSPQFGLDFPTNFGLLFALGALLLIVLVSSYGLVVEPDEAVDVQPVGLGTQLQRGFRLSVRNRSFGRYLAVRIGIVMSSYALPFYAVYARRILVAPEETVGIYLVGMTLAAVLSNLVLGRLGDRYGSRLLMRLAAVSAVLPPLAALLIAHLPGSGTDKDLVFALIFLFQGIHTTANVIGSTTYLLEVASAVERVLYIGFAHGVVGLAVFTSPLGGAIVDGVGFEALFLVSLVGGLGAAAVSLGLDEPRKAQSQIPRTTDD